MILSAKRVAGGLAILSTVALPILAPARAEAVVVNIGGNLYDVSVVITSQSDREGDFASPVSGGLMPWWKDSALAAEFARNVYDGLGSGSDPFYGPIFAFDNDPVLGEVSGVYQLLGDINVQDVVSPPPSSIDTLKYAIATEPVPLPLPLLGAVAGYRWTRRMRQSLRKKGQSLVVQC
jgi:hypothetical protein